MTRLMIVEDEESVVESLKMALSDEFEIESVASGKGCLDKMNEFRPEVILMDYRMEELNGAQILERLFTHPVRSAVVLLSAHLDMDLTRHAMKLGAIDCLAKPCDLRLLRHKLRMASGVPHPARSFAKPFALRVAEKLHTLSEPGANPEMDLESRRLQFQSILLSEALFDCGGDSRRAAERLGLQLEEFSRMAALSHVDSMSATRTVAAK